ncbi:MAG: DinB family protein [Phycisphaerae bacterium]
MRESRRGGEVFTLPLLELILHTLYHGTYHRGQANTLIKLAGGTPVSINYFEYSRLFPSP